MQVGRTEDQGLYNKPSAAVHPGALAAGTLPQYKTVQYDKIHSESHKILSGNKLPHWGFEIQCYRELSPSTHHSLIFEHRLQINASHARIAFRFLNS